MLIEYTIKSIVSIIRGLQRFSVIFEFFNRPSFLVLNGIGSDRNETDWISKIKFSAYIINKKMSLKNRLFQKKNQFRAHDEILYF